jgi:hypothetical protein
MIEGYSCNILGKDFITNPFNLEKGVRQGDPISPILFNIAVQPILNEFHLKFQGFKFSEKNLSTPRITYLAYADDLLITSQDITEFKQMIKYLIDTFNSFNIKINPLKSAIFSNVTDISKYNLNSITNMNIPIQPISYNYLGINISNNLSTDIHITKITKSMELIKKDIKRNIKSLTPHTTAQLTNSCIYPLIEYSSEILFKLNTKQLSKINKIGTTLLKYNLNLGKHHRNSFFYSEKKLNGLNLRKIENDIVWFRLRNLIRILNNPESICSKILIFTLLNFTLKRKAINSKCVPYLSSDFLVFDLMKLKMFLNYNQQTKEYTIFKLPENTTTTKEDWTNLLLHNKNIISFTNTDKDTTQENTSTPLKIAKQVYFKSRNEEYAKTISQIITSYPKLQFEFPLIKWNLLPQFQAKIIFKLHFELYG